MNGRPSRLGFAMALALIALPATSGQNPPAKPAPTLPTAAQWARDLDWLATELPQKHKDLYAKTTEIDFAYGVSSLKEALPQGTPEQNLVKVLKLIATIGDSHTGLAYRPLTLFPLTTYWYDDGIWVRNTTEEGKELLRGRITAVDGRPIEQVTAALAEVIPHENEMIVRNRVPSLLADPAILHGLGLIGRSDAARFTVRDAEGKEHAAELTAISATDKPAWRVDLDAESAGLTYLKNRTKDYWFELLPGMKTLYFQYNVCRQSPDQPFAAFVQKMFAVADAAGVNRIVVDLRLNGGGNSGQFMAFKSALKVHTALNKKGQVFVLIGRRTFSSALMNAVEMKLETPAILVGEPTGGKPNHFGEVRSQALPGSDLMLTYSTNFFKMMEADPDALYPDVRVKVLFADHLAKRDPVLSAALK